MGRRLNDWLETYVEYASYGEAPKRMHFWTGVSTLAGALRRKVWIDMAYFKWFSNFYIILVAPPGIVSKSTTASIGMNLLRQVPGIKFGPDVVTWQALVKSLGDGIEAFQYGDEWISSASLTIESSELGNLLNPHDREMVDLLVSLWDGRASFQKITKMSGNDAIQNPWINMIACTTPSWIAGNFPEYMIGGGFTSRCIFVYAEEKERFIAYPSQHIPRDLREVEARLVEDLQHISLSLCGAYQLDKGALQWGTAWYENHYKNRPLGLDDARFGGYIARKQTHVHKTAMVIAAAKRDGLVITQEDLELANIMVTDLEKDMPQVFAKIGRSEESNQVERFVEEVNRRGAIYYDDAMRMLHTFFPKASDIEGVLAGMTRAGYIRLDMSRLDAEGRPTPVVIGLRPQTGARLVPKS